MAIEEPLGVVKQPVAPTASVINNSYVAPVAQTVAPRIVSPNETVQGQMQGMMAQNSPYLQIARENSNREAAGRGMLGSSMALQAGETAAIKAAAPIAAQDASTNAAAGLSAQEANQGMIGKGFEGAVQSNLDTSKYGAESQLTAQKSTDALNLNQYIQQMNASTELAKMAHDDKVTLANRFAEMDASNEREKAAIQQSNITGKDQVIWQMNNNNATAKNAVAKIMGFDYSWSAGKSPSEVAAEKEITDKAVGVASVPTQPIGAVSPAANSGWNQVSNIGGAF